MTANAFDGAGILMFIAALALLALLSALCLGQRDGRAWTDG